MAGSIKRMLESIITQKAKGNPTLVHVTTTKLILKGLNPEKYTSATEDDPVVMQKVRSIAKEMGVSV